MDAQGGRYHLLSGRPDWAGCTERRATELGPVDVGAALDRDRRYPQTTFGWDAEAGALRLAHIDPVFVQRGRDLRPINDRRGADRDGYGTWYWISEDGRGIRRRGQQQADASTWWTLDDTTTCVPTGSFSTTGTATPLDATLAGLAITTGQYLVAGLIERRGPNALLVFDLHGGGAPLVLRWPGGVTAVPFDLAADSDGGVLVLDRVNREWWHLDRTFRVPARATAGRSRPFEPEDHATPRHASPVDVVARPIALSAEVSDAIAIAQGPDDTTLFLDRRATGASHVVVVNSSGTTRTAPLTLRAIDPERPERGSFTYEVIGHDFCFVSGGTDGAQPLPGPVLYVGDAAANQALAFALDVDGHGLTVEGVEPHPYLSTRRWGGKALLANRADVFYDIGDRWLPLEPMGECAFEETAILLTPTGFAADASPVTGQPFDSGLPGCVWHRLFLDADIPDGTSVRIRARAADDPDLLDDVPLLQQPTPYLRTAGAELPFHDPWPSTRVRPRTAGTWELLFQQVEGRYLQLELTLSGPGRSSPAIRALRAWYPRFSYVTEYLPSVYAAEDGEGRFLERFLANFEGALVELEAKMDSVSTLFDPDIAPSDALDWLGEWLGMALEPAWSDDRRRFLLRNAHVFYARRGTVPGLLGLLRVYLGSCLDDRVFDPRQRRDDPVRLVERFIVGWAGAAAAGDQGTTAFADAAHRFSVLVNEDLDADRRAMVERIVDVAKPAHTMYELRSYMNLFLVGAARVGVDTVLGAGARFVPAVLDRTDLARGYLGAAHPFDVYDRVVADRDRLGELPAL